MISLLRSPITISTFSPFYPGADSETDSPRGLRGRIELTSPLPGMPVESPLLRRVTVGTPLLGHARFLPASETRSEPTAPFSPFAPAAGSAALLSPDRERGATEEPLTLPEATPARLDGGSTPSLLRGALQTPYLLLRTPGGLPLFRDLLPLMPSSAGASDRAPHLLGSVGFSSRMRDESPLSARIPLTDSPSPSGLFVFGSPTLTNPIAQAREPAVPTPASESREPATQRRRINPPVGHLPGPVYQAPSPGLVVLPPPPPYPTPAQLSAARARFQRDAVQADRTVARAQGWQGRIPGESRATPQPAGTKRRLFAASDDE